MCCNCIYISQADKSFCTAAHYVKFVAFAHVKTPTVLRDRLTLSIFSFFSLQLAITKKILILQQNRMWFEKAYFIH
jgi:hypothetical protein